MNKKIVKNLMVASLLVTGASYGLRLYAKNKSKKQEIKKPIIEEEINIQDERTYLPLANIVKEQGKYKTKKINDNFKQVI